MYIHIVQELNLLISDNIAMPNMEVSGTVKRTSLKH